MVLPYWIIALTETPADDERGLSTQCFGCKYLQNGVLKNVRIISVRKKLSRYYFIDFFLVGMFYLKEITNMFWFKTVKILKPYRGRFNWFGQKHSDWKSVNFFYMRGEGDIGG